MKNAPNTWQLEDLITRANQVQTEHHTSETLSGGLKVRRVRWIPKRPSGWYGIRHRLRMAWLVFTGRADAVIWPGGQ